MIVFGILVVDCGGPSSRFQKESSDVHSQPGISGMISENVTVETDSLKKGDLFERPLRTR